MRRFLILVFLFVAGTEVAMGAGKIFFHNKTTHRLNISYEPLFINFITNAEQKSIDTPARSVVEKSYRNRFYNEDSFYTINIKKIKYYRMTGLVEAFTNLAGGPAPKIIGTLCDEKTGIVNIPLGQNEGVRYVHIMQQQDIHITINCNEENVFVLSAIVE